MEIPITTSSMTVTNYGVKNYLLTKSDTLDYEFEFTSKADIAKDTYMELQFGADFGLISCWLSDKFISIEESK